MFRPKTLIHLLVSLALILNGVGAAAASAVMATAQASAAAPAASKGDSQVGPQMAAMQSGCHEHDSSNSPSISASTSLSLSPSHADADVMDTGPAAGEADSTDCCKDGGCGCGCAHQSQVALAAEFLLMPAIAPASMRWEQLAEPLSPSLSKPVRPPIA